MSYETWLYLNGEVKHKISYKDSKSMCEELTELFTEREKIIKRVEILRLADTTITKIIMKS